MLPFISQTGPKIQDPNIKKLVRQNARNHVSREKGKHIDAKPLQFRLLVPESFSFSQPIDPDISLGVISAANEIVEVEDRSGDGIGTATENTILDVSPSTDHLVEPQEQDRFVSRPDSQVYGNYVGVKHAELSAKPQTSRSKKPKVRTGCMTCKARHIKCDEAKPSCLRCLKSVGTCTGYTKSTSRSMKPAHRAIAARPNTLVRQPDEKSFFSDDQESYFFRLFQDQTASDLSGAFESSFWDHILPQESTHQNFVRYAIISIAALNESAKSTQLARLATDPSKDVWQAEARKQREYALEQYDKAIRGMRTITTACDSYFRTIVIATLLVFVFETIHVRPDLAFWHALVGDRMICRWATEQWADRDSRRRGIASPAKDMLEDEILLTFCRFDTQFLTFVETRGHQVHLNGMHDGTPAVRDMPLVFSNLAEATIYWELVLRRSCHFIMYGAVRTESSKLQKDTPSTISGRTIDINAENSIYGSPFLVPDTFLEEVTARIKEIDRWSASFHKLLANGKSSSSGLREVTNIALLRMTSLSTRIAVLGTTFANETSYNIFLPEFSEIVSLARQITDNLLAISGKMPAYHFHTSVVPPLFIVLLRCRDSAVRREAIEILRMQQHDGPWDRFMIARIGSWIMQVEEEGWDGIGSIPEESRVQLTKIKMGLEEQTVMVQCVRQGGREGSGDCEVQESDLNWAETVIRGW